MSNLYRKSHLLGTKLKNIRKLNKLTLEDLSERCSQHSPKNAPSVSYLSMIENGKRLPSEEVLKQIAIVFQKDSSWFMDENLDIGYLGIKGGQKLTRTFHWNLGSSIAKIYLKGLPLSFLIKADFRNNLPTIN
ncbi:MAG: hypothetical protein CM1200mP17_00010 [Woeseia sp.]|nr:MAG: hypothetical protein CM1200mP17_00010 [Woeseia sp.]